jgi:hypothetical protein
LGEIDQHGKQGLRLLLEMMNDQSIVDVVKGAAMIQGVSFKTSSHP